MTLTCTKQITKMEETTKRSHRTKKTLCSIRELTERLPCKRRKRVTFHQVAATKHCVADNNTEDAWYSAGDYALFEKECVRTVMAFRKAHLLRIQGQPQAVYRLDTQEFTAKGLECLMSSEQKRLRSTLKHNHRLGVLMEQQAQRALGVVNTDELAAVSKLLSSDSLTAALRKGLTKGY